MASPNQSDAPTPGTVAYLATRADEAGRAYLAFARSLYDETVLPAKVRELVLVGIQTALGLEPAFRVHGPRAIAAGATRSEIMGVLMLAVVNGGVQGALDFAPIVDELFAGTLGADRPNKRDTDTHQTR